MELCIQNLSRRYSNGVQALDNVSLTIDAGTFGLLGPNGAGKSTLMRIIATLQEADSGLASDYGLVNFIQKVTELCRGKAYFTTPYTLGQYLLMDYMNRKTRTIH
jgi:ABC-type multidrug transport system ATPase subunit